MPTDFQDELDTYVAAKGAHESRCPEFDEAVLGRELTSEEQAELEALIDRRNEAAENVRFEPATSLSELRRKVEVARAECLDRDGWLAAIAEDLEGLERIAVTTCNHRGLGSQSSDGWARVHCNWDLGADPRSLQMGAD